jgi:glutathione S-transferase
MNHEFLLVLGDRKSSSWSLRVWLILKHLDVQFNEEIIELGFK